MNDKVSIIMPCFNSEKIIAKSIESVQSQTYNNWELIIVDDCSNDSSIKIIKQYSGHDSRIRLIELQENLGAGVARNTAIKETKGKYIAFLDSDDIWLSFKLEKQIKYMQDNNYLLTHSYYEKISEQDALLNEVMKSPNELSYDSMLKSNKMGCLTVVYNAEAIGRILMPDIRKRQDYGLWLKIMKNDICSYCYPEVLCQYRVRDNSISSNKLNLLKYNWALFRNIENFSIVKSAYYLTWNIIEKVIK